MEPLELLDLQKCNTVGELVDGMSRCSFGARMLGEVSQTVTELVQEPKKPIVVYDGKPKTSLLRLLRGGVKKGYFSEVCDSRKYVSRRTPSNRPTIVVGPYTERYDEPMAQKAGRIIYVNQYGQTRPGHYQDGYFPDMVPSDPNFIMPVLFKVLEERLRDKSMTVDEFLQWVEKLRFGGISPALTKGTETLFRSVSDCDCVTFATFAGAQTIAQMGLLICDGIDFGFFQHIASTGALMAHGLVEGMGLHHYKYNPAHDDRLLAREKINRVTDTLEPEENFDHIEAICRRVFDRISGRRPISPTEFHRLIGEELSRRFPNERAILKSAYERGVPVAVPAFCDSEVGNDVYVENSRRRRSHRQAQIVMNLERDTKLLLEMATSAKRIGIFSIGGGSPRNNTQNLAPLLEIIRDRLGLHKEVPVRKFRYGCRIDPTPLWFGNLSGCTYNEGGSWRKMDLKRGIFAEVQADATIAWPFIQKAVMERRGRMLSFPKRRSAARRAA